MTGEAPREDCAAVGTEESIVCERCGFEWGPADPRPACEPITLEMLRRSADSAAFRADVALEDARTGKAAGQPIDVTAFRRRAAIAEKIRHIVDVATRDKAIIAKLAPAAAEANRGKAS